MLSMMMLAGERVTAIVAAVWHKGSRGDELLHFGQILNS